MGKGDGKGERDGFVKTLRREYSIWLKGLVCLGRESLPDAKSGCAAQARGILGRWVQCRSPMAGVSITMACKPSLMWKVWVSSHLGQEVMSVTAALQLETCCYFLCKMTKRMFIISYTAAMLLHFYLSNSAWFLAFLGIEYIISPLLCLSPFILGGWFRTIQSSRSEGASKIIQYNNEPSTTTVTLNH